MSLWYTSTEHVCVNDVESCFQFTKTCLVCLVYFQINFTNKTTSQIAKGK